MAKPTPKYIEAIRRRVATCRKHTRKQATAMTERMRDVCSELFNGHFGPTVSNLWPELLCNTRTNKQMIVVQASQADVLKRRRKDIIIACGSSPEKLAIPDEETAALNAMSIEDYYIQQVCHVGRGRLSKIPEGRRKAFLDGWRRVKLEIVKSLRAKDPTNLWSRGLKALRTELKVEDIAVTMPTRLSKQGSIFEMRPPKPTLSAPPAHRLAVEILKEIEEAERGAALRHARRMGEDQEGPAGGSSGTPV